MSPRHLSLAITAWILATGCASHPAFGADALPHPVCVKREEGMFATAATRHPDATRPAGMFGARPSRRDGDLIIDGISVRFAACDEAGDIKEAFALPYSDMEMIYRLGDWLFLRSKPDARNIRQYNGFQIHPSPDQSRGRMADATLRALRARFPGQARTARPADWHDARLLIVAQGEPDLKFTTFERPVPDKKPDGEAGKEIAAGALGGALGGAGAAVLMVPETGGATLYPPLAGAMIIGGALVGAAMNAVDLQKQAQLLVTTRPWEDPVLVKAATRLGLTGSLSREILQRMAIEKSWPAATAPLFSDGCAVFEDYAMRGILGVAYLSRPDLELRPNASEYLRAPDKASYTLTLSTRASLISTVTGQEVGAIDFATPLDTLPLDMWKKDDGSYMNEAINHAVQEMADKIAMMLQRKLDGLAIPE